MAAVGYREGYNIFKKNVPGVVCEEVESHSLYKNAPGTR